MTITDPFTEAAMGHLARVDHDKSREWFDGFVACTKWAQSWLAAQETDGERAVRELHERAWHGELDYCPRCVDYEGAIWPCATILALDTARAALRDHHCTTTEETS